ncbi:protein PET100 homolog, mitochondrial [Bacillus rossius redtenbacheri]|uniref:protein PET100 homolog, mitochondrial n=1 Tax=Bacillus rossius redtenbacheri TaxID=93214 RepID=UPI002FDEA9B0
MGGWLLEVGKMALYMAFPVGMFHFFNQPEYFEEWVVKTRRAIFPPDSKTHREELEACMRQMQQRRDRELMRQLEESDES